MIYYYVLKDKKLVKMAKGKNDALKAGEKVVESTITPHDATVVNGKILGAGRG